MVCKELKEERTREREKKASILNLRIVIYICERSNDVCMLLLKIKANIQNATEMRSIILFGAYFLEGSTKIFVAYKEHT